MKKITLIYGNPNTTNVFFNDIMNPIYHGLLQLQIYDIEVIMLAKDVHPDIPNLCIGLFNHVPAHKMPNKYIMYDIEIIENANKIYLINSKCGFGASKICKNNSL